MLNELNFMMFHEIRFQTDAKSFEKQKVLFLKNLI